MSMGNSPEITGPGSPGTSLDYILPLQGNMQSGGKVPLELDHVYRLTTDRH